MTCLAHTLDPQQEPNQHSLWLLEENENDRESSTALERLNQSHRQKLFMHLFRPLIKHIYGVLGFWGFGVLGSILHDTEFPYREI